MSNKQKIRELEVRGNFQKREKKMNPNAKRCPHCKSIMRARGCCDIVGGRSWKCRNKKCGRTVRTRPEVVVPPIPIVAVSVLDRLR